MRCSAKLIEDGNQFILLKNALNRNGLSHADNKFNEVLKGFLCTVYKVVLVGLMRIHAGECFVPERIVKIAS